MAHRTDLNALSAGERQVLVNLMLPYLTDAVVAQHVTIIHSGVELFTGHRAYIADLETYLQASGGGAFVPLPMWDPANPIPLEFNVVKPQDDSTPRPPLVNLNPNMPLQPEWDYPAVCEFESGDDLGNAINGWHGGVHVSIGGTMGSLAIASAAPIFWCWHAFVDHIYWNWQLCQVECPDLVGCTLPYAKLKLRQNGLCSGSVSYVPKYVVPPERVPQPQMPPAHTHAQTIPAPPRQQEQYALAGVAAGLGHGSLPIPPAIPGHEHGSGHEHGGGREHGGGQRIPPSAYTDLTKGPLVIAQYPPAGKTKCVNGQVDLVAMVD